MKKVFKRTLNNVQMFRINMVTDTVRVKVSSDFQDCKQC